MIKFSTNQPDKDRQYFKRPGAYGVIINNHGLIACVKTKTGYFLPGGGIEENESPEDCLMRECLEELGAEISKLDIFACGSCYFYSTTLNKDMESEGYFFTCQIDNFLDVKVEDDHELIWLNKEDATKLLYLDNQKEAVRVLFSR